MASIVDDVTTIYRVLVAGRVVSAIFAQRPLPQFQVTTDWPGLTTKIARDGFFCLAGVDDLLFPVYPVAFNITVTAPFHYPITLPVNILTSSDLPISLPDIALLYKPIRLQGRVTLDDPDHTPVAGASVLIDDTAVLTLRTPLHFDHTNGTPTRPISLTGTGTVKTLISAAAQFSDIITLSDRTGLLPGDVLRLGTSDRYEYAIIASIAGNLADPGDVALAAVLQRALPVGASAELINVGVPGVGVGLQDDVLAGEGLLRLVGALTAVHIFIDDANPAQIEYHTLNAESDAAGYYRLDGIGRLDAFTLHAAAGPDNDDQEWAINYRQPVNEINFRLD